MNVRIQAAALTIALVAGACGSTGAVGTLGEPAGESVESSPGTPAPFSEPCDPHDVLEDGSVRFPDGSISLPNGDYSFPDGMTMHVDRVRMGETLEEYAAQVDLSVLVRATNNSWTQSPPGHPPRSRWAADDDVADGMSYHWREFEVVEVLSGSYDFDTLNYGNPLNRTCPGETYLLIVGVLTKSSADVDPDDWPPRYSDQHFTGPVAPYLLMADGVLQITDPHDAPHLDETLTLSDARARLGDADDRSEQTDD